MKAENITLCRVEFGKNGIEFESAENKGLTISQVIEGDTQYGIMVPANGKYFTYAVLNEDDEFTQKDAENAYKFAKQRWKIYSSLPRFRRVKKDFTGIIDFRLEFRTVETDPDKQLRSSTVMYHYYPINDVNHPLRGLCVVNKAFFFTSHGNGVFGSHFEKFGIPTQFPNRTYRTLYFEQILAHELGHGLGLPHDPEEDNMMAYRVDLMTEYPSERDIARIRAKYGRRKMSAWALLRWLKWLKYASDR